MDFRVCIVCGKDIPESRRIRHAKTCSAECYHNRQLEKYHKRNPRTFLCSATTGAVGEYRVVVDLLLKGFEVFKAVSPACSCDLAILKEGKLLRIEVKTGKYTSYEGDSVYFDKARVKADILAIVLHDKIIYQPSIEKLDI